MGFKLSALARVPTKESTSLGQRLAYNHLDENVMREEEKESENSLGRFSKKIIFIGNR